jgi:hypothetical protein
MKRQEFLKAVKLAMSPGFQSIPYLSVEMSVFSGCALDSKRRIVTMAQVASLVVGHCLTFAGTWDHSELENLEELSKRFDIVG